MIFEALACLLALWATWKLSGRSLGHGLAAALAVGFVYGIVRARFTGGAMHFLFDAALVGLYAGVFGRRWRSRDDGPVRPWVVVLTLWPVLMMCIPFQHPLVQLVGLRAAVFYLPCVLLGARAREEDLQVVARAVAVLDLVALLFGGLEFLLGVERFYPRSPVTQIIYMAQDVGAEGSLRIPGTFPTSHAYGGTMVSTLPLLFAGWQSASSHRERVLFIGAAVAAAVGVFLSATRQPALYLFALSAFLLVFLPLPPSRRLPILVGIALVAVVVVQSDRLQRFSTLTDPEVFAGRVRGSLNLGFLELLSEQPMGAGLGSAVGTSIPHFLQHLAAPQIGMENEWGRIALEQSLLGMLLWVGFVGLTIVRFPRGRRPWDLGRRLAWALTVMVWGTAFIGTGMLTSVPGTVLTLLFMGLLWRRRPAPASRALQQAQDPPRAAPIQPPARGAEDEPAQATRDQLPHRG